ncbi:protein TIFY 5A-like [Lycium barbarum]|uniref:protein TIFY 5A-like n=1 Tax=Lycium barbarum TaxID=112863 RepID=UPI00293E3111|nr:protein TIFY 5A-like [Lycium barbarum]
MRRNCNLELRLMPPSLSSFSPKNCTTPYFSMEDKESTELEKQQPLTIFHNGKLVVSDATELQAKAIIYRASREMEDKTKKTPSPMSEPSSPLLQPQTGLFMKRSLQRFLQKRKNRIQTTSPYHH